MRGFNGVIAGVLALVLCLAAALPASAAGQYGYAPADTIPTTGVPQHLLMARHGEIRVPQMYMRQVVPVRTREAPGTIIVDTRRHFLYLVLGDDRALRYGIGVAREGFEWSGVHRITRKAEWPGWTPPAAMRQRQPGLPAHMEGGINNPLGARALYIGSTLYRIHGTNQPWTIGRNVSSGCIRMTNEDVIDLYGRVKLNAKVVVL